MSTILGIFWFFLGIILLPSPTTASYSCGGRVLTETQGSIVYNSTYRTPFRNRTGMTDERCIWVLAAGQVTYNLQHHVEETHFQESCLTGTCISSSGSNDISLRNFQMVGSQNLSVNCPVLIITYHTPLSSVVSSNSGFVLRWTAVGGAAENYSPQSSHHVQTVTKSEQIIGKRYQNNELSTYLFQREPNVVEHETMVTYTSNDGPSSETDGLEGGCSDRLLVYRFEASEGYVPYIDEDDDEFGLNQICGGSSIYFPEDVLLFVFRSDESVAHTGFNFVSYSMPYCRNYFD